MDKDKSQSEIEILKFWEENNIFDRVKEKNKAGQLFSWVEGPPYPTGEAHLGHMRNWAIKDTNFRFKRFLGYNVYTRDGYDVHGLPVEQKVQKKLGIKDTKELKDKFGVDKFIDECRKYTDGIINDMKDVRKRYGLWIDQNQWQTSHPQYMSMAWRFFKKAQEKGLLYKDFRCVAWSPALETTLSDYEIKDSYAELEDPSVYVRFKVLSEFRTTKYDEFLLIWTTTPWTLEANMAIAVNKDFVYSKVLIEDEDESYVLIIAEQLVETVVEKLSKSQKIKKHKILETLKGSQLVGIRYEPAYKDNPTQKKFFEEKICHRVIHADFVTLGEGESHLDKLDRKSFKHQGPSTDSDEKKSKKKVLSEGTGLAHEAPAHGIDDADLCREEGIAQAYCVVNEQGLMIDESMWNGKNFRDANKDIMKYLEKEKIILHGSWKKHTYPLCWRSKVPIVYRTTEQWYIKRSSYIKDIIDTNKNVKWFPNSAQTNFNNLIETAGDWAISRQRFWGIPIPIFENEDGEYDVFGSKEELEKQTKTKLDDLHLDNLSKLEYEKKGKKFKHVGYTCDVWFDSGCASFASHYDENLTFEEIIRKYYPLSWITEGEDQIRGWFSSLFNVGYMVADKAPYNQVLFYGFVMAKDGQKMSKSLGNGMSGNEAIEKFGSDVTRYYLLTKNAPESKLNFDPEEFAIVNGFSNTIENIFKFCNSYLKENELKHPTIVISNLDPIDLWILYKLNTTLDSFKKDMESYRFNTALKSVEDFLVNDFSKTYLKLVKDRTDSRDENLLVIMNEVLKKSLIMLGCAMPFKCEGLYQKTKLESKKESLFLENFPEVDEVLINKTKQKEIDENFDLAQEIIGSILNSREKSKIGVRWPLSQVDVASSIDLKPKIEIFENLIKKLTNVSKINYDLGDVEINYVIKPNFKELKIDFEDISQAISVINKNKFYIAKDLKSGLGSGEYDKIKMDFERHIIKEIELKGDLISSDFSLGNIILHTHQDEILLEEGYLRELLRRVQDIRKDLGMKKTDGIKLSFENSDKYYLDLISNCEKVIKKRVGATDILQKQLKDKKEFEIKDKKLVVSYELD